MGAKMNRNIEQCSDLMDCSNRCKKANPVRARAEARKNMKMIET